MSSVTVRQRVVEQIHLQTAHSTTFVDKGVAQAINDIAADTYSGAVELADQSANILARCVRTSEAETTEALYQQVFYTGWSLIQAQPAMAPVVNLVNAVLWNIEPCETLRSMREKVTQVTRNFKRQLCMHETAIAEAVLQLLPEGACVLTHSRSTTVRAALLHAQRAGRRFHVICAEGRPGNEGRMMASELAQAGIPVTLVVDAVAISSVSQVEVVLVGADHLTANGLVNKVGTYGLSLIARVNHVPIYTLCGSEKFLPPGYVSPPQNKRPAEQVWKDAARAVVVDNYYFDHTSLNDITGVVTERGVLTRPVIEGWLASIQLHPALQYIQAT